MCGITGIASARNKIDQTALKKMLGRLKHRGPDGEGLWLGQKVALAMRRLSIIDLAGGDQPLFNEDKSLVIVGNGEIYNYIELNSLIRRRGHHPRTGSDIETAIHLYEDEGLAFVKRLRGMFALALFDKKRQQLILVRDRMGEKPLYWTEVNNQLIFSSELKSLLQFGGVSKVLNFSALDSYFHHYYISEPETALAQVHKLPAGHYLVFDLKTGGKTIKSYWQPETLAPISRGNPIARLKAEFEEACRLTLRADVPVGISLSGGLDSSAILAVSARIYKDKLRAFSVGYENQPRSDERRDARWLAEKLGVEFFETEIKTKSVIDDFPRLVFDCDDPVADIAAYPIGAVSRLAAQQKIKVLVGGIGGDELFWGYDWMRQVTKRNILSPKAPQFYEVTRGYRVAKSFFPAIVSKEFKSRLIESSNWHKPRIGKSEFSVGRYSLDRIRDYWLKSNCLTLSDRLSMSASVEMRSPFLDKRLVETALTNSQTVAGFELPGKYWFKQSLTETLPSEVLNRPKRGFTPPVAQWLCGIIRRYVHLLEGGFLVRQEILGRKRAKLLTLGWFAVPMYWYPLYQLILLEIWGREFVDGVQPVDIV